MTTKTQKKEGKLVGKKHVDELVRNYKKQRWTFNSQRLGKEDSLSTTFNLESLSEFLQRASQVKADSIRVYFGVYPENFEEHPEYSNRQTVVMVATKQTILENGKKVDKEIYIKKKEGYDILAFNFGKICPPDCGTGLPPDNDSGSIGVTIFTNKEGMRII